MSSVKLSFEGKDYEFPVVEGSEHEKGIVISDLRVGSFGILRGIKFGVLGRFRCGGGRIDIDEHERRFAGMLRLGGRRRFFSQLLGECGQHFYMRQPAGQNGSGKFITAETHPVEHQGNDQSPDEPLVFQAAWAQ